MFDHQQNQCKLVNVHFGLTNYGKMYYLIQIYNSLKSIYFNEARKAKDVSNSLKYEKIIAK